MGKAGDSNNRGVGKEMNNLQIEMVVRLSHCTFSPGTFDKRFVMALLFRATNDPGNTPLTDEQGRYLAQLFHQYRKQIGARDHNIYCELCNRELARQAEE